MNNPSKKANKGVRVVRQSLGGHHTIDIEDMKQGGTTDERDKVRAYIVYITDYLLNRKFQSM